VGTRSNSVTDSVGDVGSIRSGEPESIRGRFGTRVEDPIWHVIRFRSGGREARSTAVGGVPVRAEVAAGWCGRGRDRLVPSSGSPSTGASTRPRAQGGPRSERDAANAAPALSGRDVDETATRPPNTASTQIQGGSPATVDVGADASTTDGARGHGEEAAEQKAVVPPSTMARRGLERATATNGCRAVSASDRGGHPRRGTGKPADDQRDGWRSTRCCATEANEELSVSPKLVEGRLWSTSRSRSGRARAACCRFGDPTSPPNGDEDEQCAGEEDPRPLRSGRK